jgi:16S rRNA (cytosine967-C5)-methyltransferase
VSASDHVREQSVRKIATDILVKVDVRKAYADVLLHRVLDVCVVDDRHRGLLTELVYGTLRWRGRLDAELKTLTRRSLAETEPFLRNLLRLSLYQLKFLDKIPAYAAINEAVELAKTSGRAHSGGFVNAVLRNAVRGGKEFPLPAPKAATTAAIAEHWSHPVWIVEKWLGIFGVEETIALLAANNHPAPLVLRTNLLKGTREELFDFLRREGIEASLAPWSPQGIILKSHSPVDRLPGFNTGNFQVQGEASQLVSYLLDPRCGERILDACAAPGGKATHIAEIMGDIGSVTATDISAAKLKSIAENAARLTLRCIKTRTADFDKPLPQLPNEPYDRVLVDAPCSGLGTLRSHPESKWHRDEKDIERLAQLQGRILSRAANLLMPGGILVYSTCTLTREENEIVVEDFLANHEEFVLDDAAEYLPDQAKSMVQRRYFIALPQRHNTDGFFAARMRKATR